MRNPASSFDPAAHLRDLETQGYSIIPDFLAPQDLEAVRTGLAPYLGRHQGRNDFEGFRTERVYTLVARGKVFEEITEDARVMTLCGHYLQPGFLLTASQAICIHPGETPQPLHYDDTFYTVPRPRPPVSLSTIVAVDAFTAENGGTEVIPASHYWDDAAVGGAYRGAMSGAPMPRALEKQLVPIEMPAGACVVFLGTLVHRGGANRSRAPRLAFSNQYCQPWARTQENFFLGVPREKVRAMSPQLQSLLGYNIWPPFMGHVTASHPLKTLNDSYVNAVTSRRADDSEPQGD
jgi:ectoine hydroxylase-related dioxygenase (phytanoyl-CoA dioxygenase family)